jgi:hypothetical protein
MIEYLLDFCESESQRATVQAVIDHGSNTAAAAVLNMDRRTVDRKINAIKLRAALAGVAPDKDVDHAIPLGFEVRGTSTLYHAEQGQILQWVKTRQSDEARMALMRATVEALKEDLPRYDAVRPPATLSTDLLNCFVITDYHLGMLSWPRETGAEWNLALSQDLLLRWFATAIRRAPQADEAIFAQLGDFLHWDGWDAVTPQHKNLLDADTRFPKLVRAVISVVRQIIRMLLEKYPKIRVIMAEGNHDPASSVWMREWLPEIYSDEPRITIDNNPDPYYCHEFGDTSLFFHHGHLTKIEKVPEVFANKFRAVWGRTKHSYAHVGHKHNEKTLETPLMLVEQHRTLAAPDAFASRNGFLSQREAKVITYHRQHGRVTALTITPGMC